VFVHFLVAILLMEELLLKVEVLAEEALENLQILIGWAHLVLMAVEQFLEILLELQQMVLLEQMGHFQQEVLVV
jgi:hypothetical protein